MGVWPDVGWGRERPEGSLGGARSLRSELMSSPHLCKEGDSGRVSEPRRLDCRWSHYRTIIIPAHKLVSEAWVCVFIYGKCLGSAFHKGRALGRVRVVAGVSSAEGRAAKISYRP